jgi:glucokinase-like ROK family protein
MNTSIDSFLRKRNVVSILNILNRAQTISRAELARRTNMTPATISNLITRLEKSGMVQQIGPGESTGGRKPQLLQFKSDAFHLMGVDIGLAKVHAIISDLHGNIIEERRIEIAESDNAKTIVTRLKSVVTDLLDGGLIAREGIKGIGVSYPGLVNPETGIGMVSPNRPELNDLPVVKLLNTVSGLPVFLQNDGACMTLGQARFGHGRDARNMIGLLLGYGIGSGIIIGGELYRGMTAMTAEFGHITVVPNGPTCGCGNQGCLEVMASAAAIAQNARRIVRAGRDAALLEQVGGDVSLITSKNVDRAAREGDAAALEIMLQAAWFIGIALADIVNILDPELIVIGGGMSGAGDYFHNRIEQVVEERSYVYGVNREAPKFAVAEFGENANTIGAAALAFERVLEL